MKEVVGVRVIKVHYTYYLLFIVVVHVCSVYTENVILRPVSW